VGQEDYRWLNEWLIKNKEKEIKEAAKKHKTKHVNELKEMSAEDYLFYYFSNPEIERRLKKEMEQNRSEESKRLSFILAKLKLEYLRLQRTRV
jgi:excinuclease UvrABC ATPase subunit